MLITVKHQALMRMCPKNQTKRELMVLLALLFLALFIRFLPALVPHFWHDEVYTIAMIHSPFREILNLTAQDAHPPLYYFWVKCFAAAGRRLGGPFATLAWLRLASILPGLLTCLLAWWVARRHWGRRRALWVLALFAVSPALAYYSVELRSYSATHCLMLAGMIGLLGTMDPRARRPAAGIALFTFSMLLAFYTHALCALYLGAMGVIVLAELALRRNERRRLIGISLAAGIPMLLCFIPWLPVVFGQVERLNQQDLPWLPWASWRDLPATFFWYLPLGYLKPDLLEHAWPWLAITAIGAGMISLGTHAIWPTLRRQHRSSLQDEPTASRPDRLLAYALILTALPILAAFALSFAHISRGFLGYRYNLMASPFFNLMLLGLIFRLKRRRLRAIVLATLLALSASLGVMALWQRACEMDGIGEIAARVEPAMRSPGTGLYWINPIVLPWLERSGSARMDTFERAFASAENALDSPRESYFLSHHALVSSSPFATLDSILLEKLLARSGSARLDLSGFWDWAGAWRMDSRNLPALAAEWRMRRKAIEERRGAIPGGQVILADDPAFRAGSGWTYLDLNAGLMPERWTQGPRQRLAWTGPVRPGHYCIEAKFWRAQPYPAKEMAVRYRLPGANAWSELRSGLGAMTLTGEVTTTLPGQPLRLEMEPPTWIPAEHLPGSDDRRPLGMIFVAIELRPLDITK